MEDTNLLKEESQENQIERVVNSLEAIHEVLKSVDKVGYSISIVRRDLAKLICILGIEDEINMKYGESKDWSRENIEVILVRAKKELNYKIYHQR